MTHPSHNETTVRELIRQELPDLVREEGKIRNLVIEVGRERFADRDRTEGRIERMMDELRRDRERNDRRWEEQRAKDKRKSEEDARKWEEQWAQDKREREAQRAADWREWEAHIEDNKQLSEAVARLERTFGAVGARWGLETERSFREALAAILEKSFGVKVINVNEFDAEGTVFGRPEQVELDVVIHNGTLILIEIKSSVSKADLYVFERKVRFYERRHECKAQRRIVISPMIDPRAREAGEQLRMELYADSADVPTG